MDGPLAGLRVLDLSGMIAGGFATMTLADHGADVVMVEHPEHGDPIREWPPFDGDHSLWWKALARNKRCVTLDMKTDEGTALVHELAAEADVVIENFRPGTLESWDDDGITLDAGREIRIPASELGLGQGTPTQIRERFGLVQHLPMEFVYETPARLAEPERDRLYEWRRGDGRVSVNSATRGGVRATVNRAGHAQDIITVERLGLLEQSIKCGAGTDPPGLVAAIGDHLPAELKAVIGDD